MRSSRLLGWVLRRRNRKRVVLSRNLVLLLTRSISRVKRRQKSAIASLKSSNCKELPQLTQQKLMRLFWRNHRQGRWRKVWMVWKNYRLSLPKSIVRENSKKRWKVREDAQNLIRTKFHLKINLKVSRRATVEVLETPKKGGMTSFGGKLFKFKVFKLNRPVRVANRIINFKMKTSSHFRLRS